MSIKVEGKCTNNVCELKAVDYACDLIQKNLTAIAKSGYKKIHIMSDSEYVVKGITERYDKWVRTGTLDGKKNLNLIIPVYKKYFGLKKNLIGKIDFNLIWVKGHSVNEGNIKADRLAKLGKMGKTESKPTLSMLKNKLEQIKIKLEQIETVLEEMKKEEEDEHIQIPADETIEESYDRRGDEEEQEEIEVEHIEIPTGEQGEEQDEEQGEAQEGEQDEEQGEAQEGEQGEEQ